MCLSTCINVHTCPQGRPITNKFTLFNAIVLQNTSESLDGVADGQLLDKKAVAEAQSSIVPSLSVLREINGVDALAAKEMSSRLKSALLNVDHNLVRVDDGLLEEELR